MLEYILHIHSMERLFFYSIVQTATENLCWINMHSNVELKTSLTGIKSSLFIVHLIIEPVTADMYLTLNRWYYYYYYYCILHFFFIFRCAMCTSAETMYAYFGHFARFVSIFFLRSWNTGKDLISFDIIFLMER